MPGKGKGRGERDFSHEIVTPASEFDKESFRTKEVKPGVKLVIGCPKGEYDKSKSKCKVGTKLQKILRKK
jgi:hypothetical protein